MLTLDYSILDVRYGHRVLDVGCGAGRHSFEALRLGGRVVSVDLDDVALKDVAQLGAAMILEGETPQGATLRCTRADALRLPFADGSFERVIASEVMEHIVVDESALRELARVLEPGGMLGVSVPRRWPEQVCWLLSRRYHEAAGGHVRIYRRADLEAKLRLSDLEPFARHHAHALHTPYWWLKCALGVDRDARLARAYHSFLVWDIRRKHAFVRKAEKLLDPIMGKSLVVYARKR